MEKMIMCSGCKYELPEKEFANDKYRKTGLRYKCRACSSMEFQRWKRTPGYRVRLDRTVRERFMQKAKDSVSIWAMYTRANVVKRSKARGEETDITVAWLREIATNICPLLDIVIFYNNQKTSHNSATIDRKDNTRGYFKDNCWIISMRANSIKGSSTTDQIEKVARNLRRFGV